MFAIFWSAREKKLVGLNASGRLGFADDPGRAGEARPHPGAAVRTRSGDGARRALRMGRAAREYGTLTLAQALAPAIRLAEEGFPVTPIIAQQWASEVDRLKRDDGARATYLVEGTRAPKAGEWFRNPDLAQSFKLIADSGPQVLLRRSSSAGRSWNA